MKALLIVDIQNDFLPAGSLPVSNGDQVIPVINQLMEKGFDVIVASKDWHPKGHKSFAENHIDLKPGEYITLNGLDQVLWPIHCVQNTYGAEFALDLRTDKIDEVFHKGVDCDIDSYSAFFDNGHLKSTGLSDYLKRRGVKDLYVAGLATDYCVKYSVFDAIDLGFNVFVVSDGCRGVNLQSNDSKNAFAEMINRGAHVLESKEITFHH